ncbi:MAG TPA: alpha-ketoglutarate-dependent dioxygenase AlkB [Pseudonocardia sp.]
MTLEPAPLAIRRRAEVKRLQLSERSWVDVISGFVTEPDEELAEILDSTPWQQGEVLRYDAYVPEQRLGAGLRADGRPLLRQTEMHLRATYRETFTGVAAIRYRNGTDFQGLHSDREMRWLDDTLIAIVVLGQGRPFVIRERRPMAEVVDRAPAGADPSDLVLTPGRGDMIVMGGAMQREYLHGVPKADTPNERISLTWRWTSRRGRPDTDPSYFDGRQYSDRPRQPGTRTRRA